MKERAYKRLVAWQVAHEMCLWIYRTTKIFPQDERFGLISQMRRSASSVPTNIVEGNARRTKKDKKNFFNIALSSLEELHYQCLLSKDLEYISEDQFEEIEKLIGRTGYLANRLHSAQISL